MTEMMPDEERRPAVVRHAVDTSGTTRTFRFDRGKKIFLGICCSVTSAIGLAGALYGLTHLSQAGLWGEIVFIVTGLGAGWLAICQFRMGVQVSGEKLTIRNEQRIHMVAAADIRAISLQKKSFNIYEWWVARVELTSGKSIWIENFNCGSTRNPPKAERVAIVEEVRMLLGLGDAALTPTPGTR